MDYNSPSDPPTDPYIDPANLNRLFDELVRSHDEAEEADRALFEWQTQNTGPRVPQVFEGTDELAEYRRLQAEYQRDLSVLVQQRDSTLKNHVEKAKEAVGIIPEDGRLAYQDSRGRSYEIVHRIGSAERPIVVYRRD